VNVSVVSVAAIRGDDNVIRYARTHGILGANICTGLFVVAVRIYMLHVQECSISAMAGAGWGGGDPIAVGAAP
jgi:hypothetical protein